jgi:hypothetical protein
MSIGFAAADLQTREPFGGGFCLGHSYLPCCRAGTVRGGAAAPPNRPHRLSLGISIKTFRNQADYFNDLKTNFI